MDVTKWLNIKNIDRDCVEGETEGINIAELIYIMMVTVATAYVMKGILVSCLVYRVVRKRTHLFFWH